uniref:Putative phytol kinase 3ic n=1 Tax=Rhizophora mucronata TaxID=61149 RepID=A0A2P2K4K0_RHIMU
MKDRIHIS